MKFPKIVQILIVVVSAVLFFSACVLVPQHEDAAGAKAQRAANSSDRPLSLILQDIEQDSLPNTSDSYRVVSLTLNVLVSLTVLWVIGLLVSEDAGFYCALLFSAHPVHVQALGSYSGQFEMLSAFFTLLTIGLYDRATRNGFRLPMFLAASVCAFIATCSNQSALMLPLLLLLTRLFRVFWEIRAGQRLSVFFRWLAIDAAFWLIPIGYFSFRSFALGTLLPTSKAGWMMLVARAGESLRLCVLGDMRFGQSDTDLMWLVVGIAGVAVAAWVLGKHVTLFAAGFFAITFLGISGVDSANGAVASGVLYLPVLGVCMLAALIINQVRNTRLAQIGVLALTLCGGIASTNIVSQWENGIIVAASTVKRTADGPQRLPVSAKTLTLHSSAAAQLQLRPVR